MASVAVRTGPARKKTRARVSTSTMIYVSTGVVLSLLFLLPLLWAVFRSFQPSGDITAAPNAKDLSHLTTANYSGLITGTPTTAATSTTTVTARDTTGATGVPRFPEASAFDRMGRLLLACVSGGPPQCQSFACHCCW